jgi:hypothetical protein
VGGGGEKGNKMKFIRVSVSESVSCPSSLFVIFAFVDSSLGH